MGTTPEELVRQVYDAFNRRDTDAIVGLLDSAIELRTTVETHYGHDGVLTWIARADEIFDGFEITVEETRVLGNCVLAIARERARGKDSGVAIDQRFIHVWTIRDDRALKLEAFTERAPALEAWQTATIR